MKTKKSKIIIIILIIIAALLVAGFVLWKKGVFGGAGSEENQVYVDSVSNITGIAAGASNRYMGVVEAGQTEKINNKSGKDIGEIYVKVGDKVTAGTEIFSYDNKEQNQELERLQAEIQGYDNQIATYQQQIAELDAERSVLPEDQRFEYTTEIQSIQLDIDEVVTSKQSATKEIASIQGDMADNKVKCTIDGVVKSVNDGMSDEYDGDSAVVTILSEGSYRVKATINEQNIASISEGQAVSIKSRVDETEWKGTISSIDTDNPVKQQNMDDYYDMEDSGDAKSSQYNFYITLDDTKGLMIGQHLYVELDNGKKSKGIQIDSSYIVQDGDNAYVWVATKKNRLKKKTVTLGKFDEETGQILVKKGLALKDYIAFPSDDLREGARVVRMDEQKDSDMDGEDMMDDMIDGEMSDMDMPVQMDMNEDDMVEDLEGADD